MCYPPGSNYKELCVLFLQYIVPQHLLSRLMGALANCSCKKLKNWAIGRFIKAYKVDMSLAIKEDYRQYPTFNDFFIRHLKPSARPIAAGDDILISPVDGSVSELGKIHEGQLMQAKGTYFGLGALLAGQRDLVAAYQGGLFMTAYLSPKDYHRIHMPCDARLMKMVYVPGKLFSVNQQAVASIEGLFARNERVICHFETRTGPLALILVGAMIVGSIAVNWHGVVNAPRGKTVTVWEYHDQQIAFKKGDEMGYFKLGSTVITLTSQKAIKWVETLKADVPLKMGELVAR